MYSVPDDITDNEAYADVDLTLTQEATNAFAQALRERRTKTLRVRRGFSVEKAQQIASILQDNPFITTLDLSYQEINNNSAAVISAALLRYNSAVQTLLLMEIWIDSAALRILLQATRSKSLRNLKLVIAWDVIPLVDTVRIITETALDENSSIEKFDFGLHSMTISGAFDGTCANLIATSYRFRFLIGLSLPFTDMDAEAAVKLGKGLSENYVLRDLELQGNQLGDIGARSIAQGLTNNTTLENLDFSGCGIRGDGTRALCSVLFNKPNMRTLTLYSNSIGNEGMEAIANSGLNLLELHLASCDIGDDGAESLSRFLQQPNVRLEHLDLMYNQIGTRGMIALARGLQSNQSVITLYLTENPYNNDETSAAFADMLRNNSTLMFLHLNAEANRDAIEILLGGLRQNGSILILDVEYAYKYDQALYTSYVKRNRDAHQRAREAAMQLALLGIQRFPEEGDPMEDAQFLTNLQENNPDEYATTLLLRALLRNTGRTGLRRGLFTKAAWYLWKSRAEPVWWTPAQRREAGLETEEEKQSDTKKTKRIEAACIQCQNEARWEEKGAPSRLFCGTYCQWLKKTGMPDLRGKSAREIRQIMKVY